MGRRCGLLVRALPAKGGASCLNDGQILAHDRHRELTRSRRTVVGLLQATAKGESFMNVASLQKVIWAVADSQGLDSVLQMIVRGLAEQSEVALARIWLTAPGDICATCPMRDICPEQSRCLHLVASCGNPLRLSDSSNGSADRWSGTDGHFRRMPLNAPLRIGYAGGTGQAVLIHLPEGQEKQRWIARPDWIKEQSIRSIAAQPLIFDKRILGVLAVFSRDLMTEREFAWLRAFADQAAVAITTVRNAGQLRALLDLNNALIGHLSQESLLRAVSEALHRAVSFDWIAIALYTPEKDVFRWIAVEGLPTSDYFQPGQEVDRLENSVGWVFEQQLPLVRRDLEKEQQYANERRLAAEGMRSHCVVPLITRGSCIGVLAVASGKTALYSETEVDLLREAGNQVALAIENTQAHEEISALKVQLEKENIYLQEEIRKEHDFEEIIGNSPGLLALLDKVEQVAPTNSNILISGETGTGKELIARAIHDRSSRKSRPLVRVNCGSIPSGLVESELFGHVRGAFTGALTDRTGRFELADGGTLFLDEVGELPPDTQVKLLRVLQEREFEPVGSSRTVHVNVRIIAATNRDLEEAVKAGRFRSDLYYRLNVVPLHVPPLRERRQDIPQLVMFFLDRCSRAEGKTIRSVSPQTIDRLAKYAWPGNIRELQNIIERGVVLTKGSVLALGPDLLPVGASSASVTGDSVDAISGAPGSNGHLASLADVERSHIMRVLDQTGWLINGSQGAAGILQLHPNTLRSRMKKLKILRPDHDISEPRSVAGRNPRNTVGAERAFWTFEGTGL